MASSNLFEAAVNGDLTLQNARFLEDLEVLRDRRLREWELVDDVAADAAAAPAEESKDGDPGRIPERFRQDGELQVGLAMRPDHCPLDFGRHRSY